MSLLTEIIECICPLIHKTQPNNHAIARKAAMICKQRYQTITLLLVFDNNYRDCTGSCGDLLKEECVEKKLQDRR